MKKEEEKSTFFKDLKTFYSNPSKYLKRVGKPALFALALYIFGSLIFMKLSEHHNDTFITIFLKLVYFVGGYKIIVFLYERYGEQK